MDRQTVLAESLRQHVPHMPRIVLSGKPDDEVVGVTDHKRTALEARLYLPLDPFIQHFASPAIRCCLVDTLSKSGAFVMFPSNGVVT